MDIIKQKTAFSKPKEVWAPITPEDQTCYSISYPWTQTLGPIFGI